MNVKYSLILGSILLALLLTAMGAAAQSTVSSETAFTYQGQLLFEGQKATGPFDLQFQLFDAATGGTQIGATVVKEDILVGEGIFTVLLDFGNWTPGPRYLEIGVRQGQSNDGYTTLIPRQQITPAPLALALPGFRTEAISTTFNIIGGFAGNSVAPEVIGSVLFGGGTDNEPNRIADNYSVVAGGRNNYAGGQHNVIGGGRNNTISNTKTASVIAGGLNHLIEASTSFIGGGNGNHIADGGLVVSIGGGLANFADGVGSVVGGGERNRVTDNRSVVAGGNSNLAGNDNALSVDVEHATVSGGAFNTASASAATVGGGQSNSATGNWATVPGGSQNAAQGEYSFAAGRNAHALHDGSFVWSDNQPTVAFKSTAENQFRVRATGGAEFISGTNAEGVSGVVLNPGGGAWLSMSDRNVKENFENVAGKEVLEAVVDLPISTWNYKTQDESIRHIGPMAQDFYAAFGVGADDRHIATIDADGVALAAIQGLYQVVQEQQTQIEALEARILSLEAD